jgi:hypothetical protein
MQRRLKALVICASFLAASSPLVAQADGYISPFAGVNFGNNSGDGRLNVGANVGWMGAGIIGIEGDFGYSPDFFGDEGLFGSNSVMDLMGNVIVGIPIGGTRGAGLRPYATIGAGLLRSTFDGPPGSSGFRTNDPGMNAGVGVMGYFSNHLGMRADVRYFHNLTDNSAFNDANIDFGSFHYWRASIGLVLRP